MHSWGHLLRFRRFNWCLLLRGWLMFDIVHLFWQLERRAINQMTSSLYLETALRHVFVLFLMRLSISFGHEYVVQLHVRYCFVLHVKKQFVLNAKRWELGTVVHHSWKLTNCINQRQLTSHIFSSRQDYSHHLVFNFVQLR